jgi:hypothetical protein
VNVSQSVTNRSKTVGLTLALDESSALTTGIGTGGAGAFFFFRLSVIPSVDDESEDVEPLKLCPGELCADKERGVGSGVAECL